jgi:2-polyprenyl-6-methoxyphenol hydroxylase-like FAD-dependent oxidoreductase
MSSRAHVVIVGAGFGGLACARALARAELDVTLVDRQNHHLFQPLLYQVASAGLAPAHVAVPIRSILRQQRNVRVLLAQVAHIDLEARRVSFDPELDIAALRCATTTWCFRQALRRTTTGKPTGRGTPLRSKVSTTRSRSVGACC